MSIGVGISLSLDPPSGGQVLLPDEITTTPLLAAFSTRRVVSTYSGPSLRLRRDSDNAELDFGFIGNHLDVDAIATWLGGANGRIVIWYDQSGAGFDVDQTASLRQPVYTASQINNRPSLTFNAFPYLQRVANLWTTDGVEVMTATQTIVGGSIWKLFFSQTDSNGIFPGGWAAGTVFSLFRSLKGVAGTYRTSDTAIVHATPVLTNSRFATTTNRQSRLDQVDGPVESTAEADAPQTRFHIGSFGNALSLIGNQFMGEVLVWGAILSDEDRQALETNLNGHWGLF